MYILWSMNLLFISLMNFNLSTIFLIKNLKFMYEWNLYYFNSLMIKFICYFDWMSFMFIGTVFFITSMVILYSIEYMSLELNLNQFMNLIIIFVFSMILMIISMNLMTILMGWDILGLSSYCLVIYYQNKKSFNSGMITILMNRIGDIFILLSISIMLTFNSWNFLFYNKMNMLLMMFILIAAMTKSAQIPFSTWLPLAMAAPTPISALVHSSTLVTAGVYLLIRFNNLLSKNLLLFIMIISSFTMISSSLSANFEFDLKKIIALSTLSQLSLMMFILSFNLSMIAFFHLITHAMFKSVLFMCSGIIIHNFMNNQDIRTISLSTKYIPFVNMIFNLSSFSLAGMPFLTGFYSKDFIIEMFNMKMNNNYMYIILYISTGLTLSYSIRLIYFLNIKFIKMTFFLSIKLKSLMNYSLVMLIFMTIFFGNMMNWLMWNSLNYIILNTKLKLMIFNYLTLGLILGLLINKLNWFNNNFFLILFKFFNMMIFMPYIFNKYKINYYKMNLFMMMIQDQSWNEYLISKKIMFFMKFMNNINLMKIKFFNLIYFFSMISFLILIM